MSTPWTTWSPFQSPEVREICAHMTDAEHGTASNRAALYGLWVAATVAVPVAIATGDSSPRTLVIAAVLGTLHIACIPVWLKRQKRFLCSTSWARLQGLVPERIRLCSFRG